jgi:hypothetical protein
MKNPTIRNTVAPFTQNWVKRNEIRKRIEMRQKQIKRLEAKQNKLRLGASYSVELIGKALAEKFGYDQIEVSGPFGLGCHCSLKLSKKDWDKTIYIIFEPNLHYEEVDLQRMEIIDCSRKTGDYPENSIGAMNGFNYEKIDVTNMSLDELHDLINQVQFILPKR